MNVKKMIDMYLSLSVEEQIEIIEFTESIRRIDKEKERIEKKRVERKEKLNNLKKIG